MPTCSCCPHRTSGVFEELADLLPDDGRHDEVIDGSLVVTPPPSQFHQLVSWRLMRLLDRQASAGWFAINGLAGPFGTDMRSPDVAVVGSGAPLTDRGRRYPVDRSGSVSSWKSSVLAPRRPTGSSSLPSTPPPASPSSGASSSIPTSSSTPSASTRARTSRPGTGGALRSRGDRPRDSDPRAVTKRHGQHLVFRHQVPRQHMPCCQASRAADSITAGTTASASATSARVGVSPGWRLWNLHVTSKP
jgi:hypothetical protein